MNKLLVNIRYFIAPLLILVTLAGVLAGGVWAWTGVGLLGVGIIPVSYTHLRAHET